MSGGGYDDNGQWIWNCNCDPGPEGQHQWYCARSGPPPRTCTCEPGQLDLTGHHHEMCPALDDR